MKKILSFFYYYIWYLVLYLKEQVQFLEENQHQNQNLVLKILLILFHQVLVYLVKQQV